MSIIYIPQGKAREFSPLAANLYDGCNFGCKYCYACHIRFRTREDYLDVFPRRNVLSELEKDCKKFTYSDKQVLLTFLSDPYNHLEKDLRITRDALKLFYKYKIPVSILTKSKTVIDDLDIIKKFGNNISVGFTLTFSNNNSSIQFEPKASLPDERLAILMILKENNVNTWASFEPVINPNESLEMIEKSIQFVDIYKIGKINNFQGLDKKIDWNEFLSDAVAILRNNEKPFYIKYDLRQAAYKVKLFGNEVNMDEFLTPAFERNDLF